MATHSIESDRSKAYSNNLRGRMVYQRSLFYSQIARNLNVNPSTVYRIVKLFDETGTVCSIQAFHINTAKTTLTFRNIKSFLTSSTWGHKQLKRLPRRNVSRSLSIPWWLVQRPPTIVYHVGWRSTSYTVVPSFGLCHMHWFSHHCNFIARCENILHF